LCFSFFQFSFTAAIHINLSRVDISCTVPSLNSNASILRSRVALEVKKAPTRLTTTTNVFVSDEKPGFRP